MARCLVFYFLVILLCPSPAFSASSLFQPGLKTGGLWQKEQNVRFDYNVWYPSRRTPGIHSFPPWTIRGALNAKPADGKFPLIILSHPSPANRFSFSLLASWLACRGFVILTPTHGKDNLDNLEDWSTWSQLKNRVAEICAALDFIIKDHFFREIIDSERIGYIGMGAGASAGLLLGGALPDCSFGAGAGNSLNKNQMLHPGVEDKIKSICANFPLQKSLANPAIKAMALIAPEYSFFFSRESFRHFYPPVLLASCGLPEENVKGVETLGSYLGQKAFFMELPDTDITGLLDDCPETLLQELPELCESVTKNVRHKTRMILENELLTFFNRYLVQPTKLTPLPDPPELEPPVKAKPEPPPGKNAGRKNKKGNKP